MDGELEEPSIKKFNTFNVNKPTFDPLYHEKKRMADKEEAERKNRQGTLGAVATIVSSLGFTKNDKTEDIVKVVECLYEALIKKVCVSNLTLGSITADSIDDIAPPVKKEQVLPTVLAKKETKKEDSLEDGLEEFVSSDDENLFDNSNLEEELPF